VNGDTVARLLKLMPATATAAPEAAATPGQGPPAPAAPRPMAAPDRSLKAGVEQIEREQIQAALERCGWVQARAARLLGITPRMIGYKIRKYGLSPTDPALLPASRARDEEA